MSLLSTWYPLIKDNKNQGLDGIDLTTVGSVTYTDGKIGKAATFPGASGTRFRRACFPAQTVWSCAAWVRCNAATSASQWAFNNGRDSNNDGWHCYFSAAGTTMYLRIGSSTWSQASTLGTWYHIAMTIDSDSKYTFYVNGEQKSTGTVATLPDYTECNNTMAIGGFYYNGGDIYPLNGQVQDFRYYDHVLSKREVKELSKGLCLHVPLDWGANPNMVKNSYTFMNKSAGSSNQWTNSGLTYNSSSVIEDDTAPTKWVLKRVITNAKETNVGGSGCFYGIGSKGLATTDLTENEYYTWSFWAKSDSGVPSGLGAGSVVESQTHISNTGFGALDSNWRKHTVTFKFTKTDRLTNCFYITVPASSTVDFQICGLKLEKGQVATPYIPHVEEAAYTAGGYANKYAEDCSGYQRSNSKSGMSGGTATMSTDCPKNTGTYFNGYQLWFDNAFPSGTTPPFTIAFWQKGVAKTQAIYSDVCWLNVGPASSTFATTRFRLETVSTDGTSSGYVWYGNGVVTTSGGLCGSPATAGTWRHLALTFDGTTFRQYINGTQYNTSTLGSDYAGFKTYGEFAIGDTSNIQVELADFRTYATCLSADDIKALYNIGAEIDNSGKVYCNNMVEV